MKELLEFVDGKKRRIALACALTANMLFGVEFPGKWYVWSALILLAVLFGGADILQNVKAPK